MNPLQTLLLVLISLGFIQVVVWFFYDRKWKKKQDVADKQYREMKVVSDRFLTVVK